MPGGNIYETFHQSEGHFGENSSNSKKEDKWTWRSGPTWSPDTPSPHPGAPLAIDLVLIGSKGLGWTSLGLEGPPSAIKRLHRPTNRLRTHVTASRSFPSPLDGEVVEIKGWTMP